MTADHQGPEDGDWSTGQYPQPQAYAYEPYEQQAHQQQEYASYEQQQGYAQPYQEQPHQQQGGYEQQPVYQQAGYEQAGYEQQPVYQQQGYAQPYQGQPYQEQAYQQQPPLYQQPVYEQPVYEQPRYEQPAAPASPAPVPPAPVPPPRSTSVPAPPRPRPAPPAPAPAAPAAPAEPSEQVGGRRAATKPAREGDQDAYQTGEFTFVDEPAEETEDVIDWLKFAESRTERRDERRRKLRTRLIGGAVAVALLAGGTVGYLFHTGALGGSQSAAAAVGQRSVVVVHLRDLQGKVSSVLLVNDAAGHKGSMLLLPDSLQLPTGGDTPTTQLSAAMDSVGPASTRDALADLLGAPVAGTWRLDTPYLRLLVAQLGGVKVDTNAAVNGPDGKPLVGQGKGQLLSGDGAVAYATYQAPGESRDAQLNRFGQVLTAAIAAMPTKLSDATAVVDKMGAVLDPSLPEKALAGLLVELAQQAGAGHFGTTELPVQPDGTLDQAKAAPVVKDVLGSTVHLAAATSAPARVSVVDASGSGGAAALSAQVQVVGAGLNFVPGGATVSAQQTSEIDYTDDGRLAAAQSLAATLGLPGSVVKKVTTAQTADLVVVLGKDYQPPKQ
ncbi:LytR C-terminal domain-containing protein [Kitasatospora sp. NBC_01287]|uniref:LCP family protein n=1 Tax=Kitasatospora sp. NBC_01287 TaxID=2903573 RepID=UPI00224EBE74|nr:LCP family protein [Kitasatospora sp. NBC_01287]MCX4749025.1 LytR C-terminal domain-containing protein [Kitasatospora sp. NBC_01287]